MEDDWPPLEECPQYQAGLLSHFIDCRYPWEDEEKEDEWFNLYEPAGSVDVETMRKELRIAKKFLHQVRTTRGYGVTCPFLMHHCHITPIMEIPQRREAYVENAMPLALTHISQKTGKAYELVKVKNVVVVSSSMVVFLTFDAKECVRDSVPETFLAMVSVRGVGGGVRECLLKPDHDADWGANEDKGLVNYDIWKPKVVQKVEQFQMTTF